MTMSIRTVAGSITPDELGPTLVHEHVLFAYPGYTGDVTCGPFDHDAVIEKCVAACHEAKAYGVRTMVDATPNECGRDPLFLQELSERTEINIICSTGYYYEGQGTPHYFNFRRALGFPVEEEIYEMMVREITSGIGNTGIRAGVIKLGSSKDKITDYEQLFFRAGARAHRETGVPIITHTTEGTMGPEQAELLISLGADPKKIQIGHMDGSTDTSYHRATMDHGVMIAFDSCGIQRMLAMPMDSDRVEVLTQLLKGDYGDQIMLSHDYVMHWLGRPLPVPPPIQQLLPNWHLSGIFTFHLPSLRENGISEAQIEALLIENPRRLFTGG